MPVEQRLEENSIKRENKKKKEYLKGYRKHKKKIA